MRGTSVSCEGDNADRRYTVIRELQYFGNPEAIDVHGGNAAQHMALADALRTLEKAAAKVNTDRRGRPGAALPLGWKEYDALLILLKATRVNGA